MQSPAAVEVFKQIASGRVRHADDGQDLLQYGLLAFIALATLGAVWLTIAGNL